MSVSHNSELREFCEFAAQIANISRDDVTPEEALSMWRREKGPAEFDEEVEAIREALVDRENGDHGRPWSEVLAEINEEFGLKPRS